MSYFAIQILSLCNIAADPLAKFKATLKVRAEPRLLPPSPWNQRIFTPKHSESVIYVTTLSVIVPRGTNCLQVGAAAYYSASWIGRTMHTSRLLSFSCLPSLEHFQTLPLPQLQIL